ncbi:MULTISPECIES: hypothetical protein [unclassified Pseudoalteromonas]|uniref:hypothetical protein n=1 Tax=unclassified Pseudoalteromonas TaxID=194690 RepID=UPI00301582BD
METDIKWPHIDGTIQVHDVLKGKQVKQVQIKTGLGGGDCGIPFVVGKHYSVFVNKDGEHAGACDATQQVNIYDKEDYINKINSFRNK